MRWYGIISLPSPYECYFPSVDVHLPTSFTSFWTPVRRLCPLISRFPLSVLKFIVFAIKLFSVMVFSLFIWLNKCWVKIEVEIFLRLFLFWVHSFLLRVIFFLWRLIALCYSVVKVHNWLLVFFIIQLFMNFSFLYFVNPSAVWAFGSLLPKIYELYFLLQPLLRSSCWSSASNFFRFTFFIYNHFPSWTYPFSFWVSYY